MTANMKNTETRTTVAVIDRTRFVVMSDHTDDNCFRICAFSSRSSRDGTDTDELVRR
jgi:hypothetical protein